MVEDAHQGSLKNHRQQTADLSEEMMLKYQWQLEDVEENDEEEEIGKDVDIFV